MSILCLMFGHKPQERIHSGAEYMTVHPCGVDGINRHHAYLKAECQRCKESYVAGKIHIPDKIK
jgi:hypothetical protein